MIYVCIVKPYYYLHIIVLIVCQFEELSKVSASRIDILYCLAACHSNSKLKVQHQTPPLHLSCSSIFRSPGGRGHCHFEILSIIAKILSRFIATNTPPPHFHVRA